MRADSLIPVMRAHLDSMARIPPASMAGMVGIHDALTSRMLDAMGADMAMMGMMGDAVWVALTDSVKRDLADLPALSGQALTTRLRSHVSRTRRLLTMHEGMMRSP